MKTNFFRIVSIFCCLILVMSATPVVLSGESVTLSKKLYVTDINLQDDFSDDSFLVVVKKEYNHRNIDWNQRFSSSEIKSIENLTDVGSEETLENDNKIFKISLTKPSKEKVVSYVRKFEKYPEVYSASPNYYGTVDSDDTAGDLDYSTFVNEYQNYVASSSGNMTSTVVPTTPNDPCYADYQYFYYPNMSVPQAWSITTGSSSVKVGVIDTGIYNHIDFGSNLIAGQNFYEQDLPSDTIDIHGHGTHVAGIIGAVGNNNIGVAGVAWNVSLVPLKASFVDENEKTRMDAAAVIGAVTYATENDIDILNCSFSFPTFIQAMYQAMQLYPGLIVCSAGNDASNIDVSPVYPACFDLENIITVANAISFTSDCPLVSSSNYGVDSVDIAAYGHGTWSTELNNTYDGRGGTSMAAPMVSGAAVLLLARNPNLTANEIKYVLLKTADVKTGLVGKVASDGLLNVVNALQAVTTGNQVRNISTEISIPSINDLGELEIEVNYNGDKFDFLSATLESDFLIGGAIDSSIPGKVIVTYGKSTLGTTAGRVVKCKFNSRIKLPIESTDMVYNVVASKDISGEHFNLSSTTQTALMGDVDFDNEINGDDVQILYDVVSGSAFLNDLQSFASDFDDNDIVDSRDALRLVRYVSNILNTLW